MYYSGIAYCLVDGVMDCTCSATDGDRWVVVTVEFDVELYINEYTAIPEIATIVPKTEKTPTLSLISSRSIKSSSGFTK